MYLTQNTIITQKDLNIFYLIRKSQYGESQIKTCFSNLKKYVSFSCNSTTQVEVQIEYGLTKFNCLKQDHDFRI